MFAVYKHDVCVCFIVLVWARRGTELYDLVEKHGWHASAKAGELLAIPAGQILLHYSPTATTALRWALASDEADVQRNMSVMCEGLLRSYPSLKETLYSAWTAYLQRCLQA